MIDTLKRAKLLESEIVAHRRHIHANPELSFEEAETSRYVAQQLEKLGLTPVTGVGGYGLYTDIGGGSKTKVAIRADMDALPIQEENSCQYSSNNTGVMHACGHDAHTACLLGAASLLVQNPPQNGVIRLVFQPAEESSNEEGKSGASLMLAAGAYDEVEAVVGLHVFPDLQAGKVALRSGPFLAACARFDITLHGKGAHGAFPQEGIDSIVISSQVLQAIQTITSRRKSALEPAVITIGGIKSNTFRSNIIADSVELTGTVRYFHENTEKLIREELENCLQIAECMGGSYEIEYTVENPPLSNHPKIHAVMREKALAIAGQENVLEAPMEMGAEDFAFISDKLPACYMALGVGKPGIESKLHTSTFDLDESALPLGTTILVETALALLENK